MAKLSQNSNLVSYLQVNRKHEASQWVHIYIISCPFTSGNVSLNEALCSFRYAIHVFGLFSRARVQASDQLHEEPFCFIKLVLGLHISHRLHRKAAVSSLTFQIHPVDRSDLWLSADLWSLRVPLRFTCMLPGTAGPSQCSCSSLSSGSPWIISLPGH